MQKRPVGLLWALGLMVLCGRESQGAEQPQDFLKVPKVGDYTIRVLTPTVLELTYINTKQRNPAGLASWNWVNASGQFAPPNASGIRVLVNGETNAVTGLGFKRRPAYAPLQVWDLRIGNHLYLKLASRINPNATVRVSNDGSFWPAAMEFTTTADPLRFSPAIHVNQEGYLPGYPKKAVVGYYLGNLGEMSIPSAGFSLVNASGTTVFTGNLTPRKDVGFTYQPTPYQATHEADFTGLITAGEYRLVVPGLGASLPFRIDEGLGMNFARTYALGLFHQRSGYDVAMPYTRFTHAADHMAPAIVPTNAAAPYAFTWKTIADYAGHTNTANPPQTAPRMLTPADQLFPFVTTQPVDVSGGHFEAGNYSKPSWNNAQIIHVLMFAADAFPGVAMLDNLGLPESGDGISDVLQEAKWAANGLLKMQDADGGFYYMIHPVNREYEYDMLPENGDPQVVWPKNTASTAASVAALAQCASSPLMKQAYPQAAAAYWTAAERGWRFLTNAIAKHGRAGAYQRIMHFDDTFTHDDDLAWAACEMFTATGQLEYRALLESWFPDPTDPRTARWGWWKMHGSYGNAVRSYAAAVRTQRLLPSQLNPVYLSRCQQAIASWGTDNLRWSQQNAYGTSFPDHTKRVLDTGWYYSSEQAFDLAVAQEFSPNAQYVDAILRNLNFEAGCNPVNVSYVTGLGWKRQREIVDQYSANDRRVLPKIGVPISNLQAGFVNTWMYGTEPAALTFPSDTSATAPYPFYDRWSDFWNTTTEASTPNIVRGFATAVWLAAHTSLATQPWRFASATLLGPSITAPGRAVSVNLVADPSLANARITWEASGEEPVFGNTSYTFTPRTQGPQWVEAEVHWPDGRRAFAIHSLMVTPNAGPELRSPQKLSNGTFSIVLIGKPAATYVLQSSTDLLTWQNISTNTLPGSGALEITDPAPAIATRLYYRAVLVP